MLSSEVHPGARSTNKANIMREFLKNPRIDISKPPTSSYKLIGINMENMRILYGE